MAESTSAPASSPTNLWAENFLLILPSCSSKSPGHIYENRLGECLTMLPRDHYDSTDVTFLLSSGAKLSAFVQLARSYCGPKVLVGSMSDEHMWLASAMDFIVATPFQASKHQTSHVKAILVDTASGDDSIVAQALEFAYDLTGFSEVVEAKVGKDALLTGPLWNMILMDKRLPFSPEQPAYPSNKFMASVRSSLPEAASCPGLGDPIFIRCIKTFSREESNIIFQDWSGVLAFLPGLVRGALKGVSPPLLLAPKEMLPGLCKLVQACANEMGISGLQTGRHRGARVIVDCPDDLILPQHVDRLVVVEADRLLASASGWKIQRFFRHCPVGIHAVEGVAALEELVQKPHIVPRPVVTLEDVYQFSAQVDSNDEKLDLLCRIWKQLVFKPAYRFSIFCNSAYTVNKVVKALIHKGLDAFGQHKGQEVDQRVNTYRSSVLVTEVYVRAAQDVINYDLPSCYDEYLQRVGKDRSREVRKVVINIGTAQELRAIPLDMVPLPSDCTLLHSRLSKLFNN